MRGVPSRINTRKDAENCVALALSGDLDRAAVKKRLNDLLSDEMYWRFKADVSSTYVPLANEQVIQETVAGTTKYHCFESVANPNATYLKMGFASKADLQNLINQL